jgi:hypothetical protein
MRTIVVCGDSLIMSSIGATLDRVGQVVQLDADQPDAALRLRALSPEIVVFDLAHARADFALELLREYPALLLIGVDLDRDCMLVLSGRQPRLLTTDDLLKVIESH